MTARTQKRIAKATCCANLRKRSTAGSCLGMSLAYTVENHKSQDVHAMKTENMLPLVNEYGYLHTSQVFFLLCESHVVKLNDGSALSREAQRIGNTPVLVDIAYRPRAFTGVKERLIRLSRRTADSASVLICVGFRYWSR
jgi:hypothetical protein